MDVTRANFGTWVSVDGELGSDGVILYSNERFVRFREVVETIPPNEYPKRVEPISGPFEIRDFGDVNRLSWAAGACVAPQKQKLASWADRFGIWIDADALVIVDTTRSTLTRLTCEPLLRTFSSPIAHAGKLWIGGRHSIVVIALADLEAVLDRDDGVVEITIRETYPIHKPAQTARGRVLRLSETQATLTVREREIEIPIVEGLVRGMEVILRDELWHDLFIQIELPDRPPRALYKVVETRTVEAAVSHAPAIDPAFGGVASSDAPARQAELDRLFGELAMAPDDDATRSVLVDLLEEGGEPYAPHLALLLAGETGEATRRDALGTLANYLTQIEYRGGLPWSASLSRSAPRDELIGDAVAADQRLGFFHTLRLGDGQDDIYTKLVSSPRACGLRHVDAPNRHVLAALIANNRCQVTHLYGVKFTTRTMIEQLADPTFDRVQMIETQTSVGYVAKLFEFVIADELRIFARAPRHLVLTERTANDDSLAPYVLAAWDRLPLAAISFAGVTLSRDGKRTAIHTAPDAPTAAVAEVQRVLGV